MTDVAVITDCLSGIADVLSIMTTEATSGIEMADVVRMGLPIGSHLGKEISTEDTLHLNNRSLNLRLLL